MAQAAAESGVATRPIEDMEAGKPVALCLPNRHAHAPRDHRRKALPDAQKRVAMPTAKTAPCVQRLAIDDKIAHPILIGRPRRHLPPALKRLACACQIGKGCGSAPKTIHASASIGTYHQLMKREGATPGWPRRPCAAPTPSSPR